jgi:hypothetical protein
MLGNVIVTPTSYFLLRGVAGANAWNVYYIANVTRADTIQTSTNAGTAWSDFAGTVDAHIHQYDGTEIFHYYACANDTLGNGNCSDVRSDLIDLKGLPPSSPSVYAPAESAYSGNITINYTASASPNGYPISFYNISLVNLSEEFSLSIQPNNSLALSYVWDSTAAVDGQYYIKVVACDDQGQCSAGFSENFSIANNPYISIVLNFSSVGFGLLGGNTTNNPAANTYQINVSTNCNAQVNFSALNPTLANGSYNIPSSNMKFNYTVNTNDYPDLLSFDADRLVNVSGSDIVYPRYYLDIPANQHAGLYAGSQSITASC